MSWDQKLRDAQFERPEPEVDPWRVPLAGVLRGVEAVGTGALLDFLNVPKTSANSRRLARSMHQLGYGPIKSRRLMPGGFHGTTIRGWMRTVRGSETSAPASQRTLRDPGLESSDGDPLLRIDEVRALRAELVKQAEEISQLRADISLLMKRATSEPIPLPNPPAPGGVL